MKNSIHNPKSSFPAADRNLPRTFRRSTSVDSVLHKHEAGKHSPHKGDAPCIVSDDRWKKRMRTLLRHSKYIIYRNSINVFYDSNTIRDNSLEDFAGSAGMRIIPDILSDGASVDCVDLNL